MTSRAKRFRDRRANVRARPPLRVGATDELAGLGRVEQLVLRGDGLTTTSLEILTGDRISVVVDGHWQIVVPIVSSDLLPGSTLNFDHDGPDVDGYLAAAATHLGAEPGQTLLVREVLLVGDRDSDVTRVHGAAEVVALRDALPASVTAALAATGEPIGRLLRDAGLSVVRELRQWGHLPAGPRADRLGDGLVPASRVLGRTYVMTLDGRPIVALTERFCPHVFASSAPAPGSTRGRTVVP